MTEVLSRALPDGSAAVPPEVAAWVEAGRAVLAVAEQADRWEPVTRWLVLGELDRVDRLMAAVRGKVVTAERDAGTWSLRGDRDLAGFLGSQSHQGRGAGLAAVGQAGTLAAMPAVADALVDGPVTTTHVAQITRATAGSAALAAELATPAGQAQVVELAGRLDGAAFGKALTQLSAALDPGARQRSHDEQRAERFLLLTHTPSGTVLKGRLDVLAGRELGKALDALSPRPGVDDDRSRQQRHADALTAMARRVVTDPHTTPDAVAPVQAVITFTQETWTALRTARDEGFPDGVRPAGRRDRHRPSGRPARASSIDEFAPCEDVTAPAQRANVVPTPGSAVDVMDRLRGVDPVVDEAGQAWPASEIGRVLCDCALTWAVVGTKSADLNLGRESRLFKRQHWLALYAAGTRSCAVPGCGMPLAYTELHHIAWWVRDNGPTNPANCAPYCSFHHHEIHRLGITITRRADGTLDHHHPDGRRYGAPPGSGEGRSLPSGDLTAATDRDSRSRGAVDRSTSAAYARQFQRSAEPANARGSRPPSPVSRAAPQSAPASDGSGEDPPPDLLTLLSA